MIKITRAFTKKVQVKTYEPVESFCAVEADVDEANLEAMSEKLTAFCEAEVDKVIGPIVEARDNARADAIEKKDRARQTAESETESLLD